PDSAYFYNDTLQVESSLLSVQELTTQTTFTFMLGRPNKFAMLDSIVIRTGTVVLPTTPAKLPVPFTGTDKKDIWMKLSTTPVPSSTVVVTTPAGTVINHVQIYRDTNMTVTGPADLTGNKPQVQLNNSTL